VVQVYASRDFPSVLPVKFQLQRSQVFSLKTKCWL